MRRTGVTECQECKNLTQRYESVLAQHAALSLAHLTAIQSGDLGEARALDVSRFDTAERVKLAEEKLRAHRAGHNKRIRTAGGGYEE